jgi:hypothetical protein
LDFTDRDRRFAAALFPDKNPSLDPEVTLQPGSLELDLVDFTATALAIALSLPAPHPVK